MNIKELDLIEKYIFNKLQGEELQNFKNRMNQDPAFREKTETHAAIIDNLGLFGKRKNLKTKLNAIHDEIEKEQAEQNTKYQIRNFFSRHRTTIAVAASVALISVSSTFFTVNYVNSLQQSTHANYKELKKEISRIKSTQHALHSKSKPADFISQELQAGGTGFLISPDGFFATSLHVIKGADNIYLENNKWGKLPAKVVSTNEEFDLAILQVSGQKFDLKYPVLNFYDGKTMLGEKVFTLGFPKEDIVYGEGSLSSLTGYENDTTSFQISVPLNPGTSGSPLFNEKGQVIGMVSGKQLESEGASFALKAFYLQQLIEQDSLSLKLPARSSLKGQARTSQLDKLKDYIFAVKVYGGGRK